MYRLFYNISVAAVWQQPWMQQYGYLWIYLNPDGDTGSYMLSSTRMTSAELQESVLFP